MSTFVLSDPSPTLFQCPQGPKGKKREPATFCVTSWMGTQTEVTTRRACWSEVVGKRDANGHFESFLSMFGIQLTDKDHTLGLLFSSFMRVLFASQ